TPMMRQPAPVETCTPRRPGAETPQCGHARASLLTSFPHSRQVVIAMTSFPRSPLPAGLGGILHLVTHDAEQTARPAAEGRPAVWGEELLGKRPDQIDRVFAFRVLLAHFREALTSEMVDLLMGTGEDHLGERPT